MKECDGYRYDIQFYLDDGLCGRDIAEFSAHLELCGDCRQELAAEEELSRLLRRSRPFYPVPDGLRDRIHQAIAFSQSPMTRRRRSKRPGVE
jgi:anti-sigma factor (TIGR02949 family)